jgi:hypothetical protein
MPRLTRELLPGYFCFMKSRFMLAVLFASLAGSSTLNVMTLPLTYLSLAIASGLFATKKE